VHFLLKRASVMSLTIVFGLNGIHTQRYYICFVSQRKGLKGIEAEKSRNALRDNMNT
jgi:hypothetical protein